MGSVKPSAKSGASKAGLEMVKQEDVIVAVLIADSFSVRFAPITESKPKALIPVVNRPMIDYSLESLLTSGVQKTYIYCVSHADQIRQYLKNSKWTKAVSPMSVEILSQSPDDCRSLGDCLRDIDNKSLIRGDFILISSDVISNVQLVPIMEKHKEKKKTDKGLIMTHVFKKCHTGHRSRPLEEEVVLAINPSTERILNFQQTANLKKLSFPLEMFKEHGQVELRYDLADAHISICTPLVLPLFTDNFDYETWADFIRGILTNEDILGNTIYCHQLEGAYAAQISNVPMYDAVSKDIIQRWAYPLVPDLSRSEGVPRHTLSRHNVYKQPDVVLAKGSVLEIDVVVGKGTAVGERTHVTQSVIGSRCAIGNDVHIRHAYIWDNVIIKDNCQIDVALIADGVVLNEAVELGRGCVLGPGVSLSAGSKIPPNTRLSAHPSKHDDGFSDDEDDAAEPVTPGSSAYVYHPVRDEGSDEESLADEFWGLNLQDELEDEEDDDEDEDVGDEEAEEEEADEGELPEDMNARSFYNEVLESLQRGYEEKIKGDNLVLEINSSKYAYNVSMKEVNTLVVKAILSLPAVLNRDSTLSSQKYLQALVPMLKHFLPVLCNYLKNKQSQLECLLALEEYGVHHHYCAQVICQVLKLLYDTDVLSEEAILEWNSNPPEDPSALGSVRRIVVPFIQWLEEAEEESDSD